ncbi:hypothetical protein [Alloprevotella tannerae]|uniref:hypothetical protein n=1 Tax=Alloprevotella tannerae TaxID=76122 RepID=UPI00058C2B54|nr:hypothetical protein [Alloprevotella tannerae]
MITSKRQRSLEPLAAWMFSRICACEEPRPDCVLRWLCCARGASYNLLSLLSFLQNMPHLRVAARALFRIFTVLAYGLLPPNNGLPGTNDSLVGANDGLPPANDNNAVCRLRRTNCVRRSVRRSFSAGL